MPGKLGISIVFLLLLSVMAALGSPETSSGTSTLNIDWVYFFSSLALFVLLGYSIRAILENGIVIPKGERKSQGSLLPALIILAAIFVAIYKLSHRNPPEIRANVTAPTGPLWQIESFGHDVVRIIYRPLPDYLYLIPLLIFLILVLTARRRKVERDEIDVKFDSSLTYESIEGTPAERVVKMYKNVVAGLVERGYPYRKSWTHWEHEEKLRKIFPNLDDLDTLTRIFERAKYSGRLNSEEVEQARRSYDRLMNLLR
ncbi:DUF4129 domain-containing protein [Thermococcus sp.]